MPSLRVIAGRCRTEYDHGDDTTVTQGRVLVVCKPDNTLLVHDAGGYQPVAWLTRPASLVVDGDRVEATDGDQRLRVDVLESFGRGSYPTGEAGTPVGACPDCDGTLVRSGTRVHCATCGDSYGLPADATVAPEDRCADCDLPTVTLERGDRFRVCLDAACGSYVEQVRDAFDEAWDCPDCGSGLRVLRRGGLLLGCDAYPDCETSYSFPAGLATGTCDCGLPVFETATGHRCLDSACSTA